MVVNDTTDLSEGLPVINNTTNLSEGLLVINDMSNLSERLPIINDTTNLSEGLPVINDTSAKMACGVVLSINALMTCVVDELYSCPLNQCLDDLCG